MQVAANGMQFEVEDHGSPGGEPLLLIMGLGMQLVAWPDAFVARLVTRGYRVIRFDNRDIGLSQHLDHFGVPNLVLGSLRYSVGLQVKAPYSLADMADDAAGILDALDLASAHICGASMGGMIAQQLAVRHPARVRSLTLMMTSSGARHLPGPSMKVRSALIGRPRDPNNVPSVIAHYVKLYRLIGSPGFPDDEAKLSERLGNWVRRSYRPQGSARQMLAIAADVKRATLIEKIRVPTRIIHGRQDALVPAAAGIELAGKIRGAQLDLIEGMGHDLPIELWPRFVAGIDAVAGRA